jgi:ubiquinone/menaquinone biosynthesis C-methylase UbiE
VIATGFDSIAAEYDALWNSTAVGSSQRRAVWRWIDPLFQPGQRLLDIGCGDGEDALHFAARGVNVDAFDASIRMVEVARSRGVNVRRLRVEELASVEGHYDGVLADFGVLNCVEHLDSVAQQLGRLVRFGGHVAICLMGLCCLWEVAHFIRRRNIEKAFRRFRSGMNRTSLGVDVQYPSTASLRKDFSEGFKLRRWCGIGLCVPPSYVSGLRERTIRTFGTVDRHVAHRPCLRAMADHRLYLFERI